MATREDYDNLKPGDVIIDTADNEILFVLGKSYVGVSAVVARTIFESKWGFADKAGTNVVRTCVYTDGNLTPWWAGKLIIVKAKSRKADNNEG